MNIFQKILKTQNTIILDGALGTLMQEKGYNVSDSLWSARFLDENPNVIANIHKEYLQSGADCIITSSYQASIEGFLEKGFKKEKAIELIKLSIKIAIQTRDDFWDSLEDKRNRIKPLVAASIGPYGAYLANGAEYTGVYGISDAKLKEFHKKRLELIVEEKPDIIACETLPSFKEAQILCEHLKKYKNIESWICFSAKDDLSTNAGDNIIEAAKFLDTQEHISAIGINCTHPKYIASLIKKFKDNSSKPIVVYPNGGSKYNPITKKWEKAQITANEYVKMSQLWRASGATIIGGCCETGLEEIEALSKYLK